MVGARQGGVGLERGSKEGWGWVYVCVPMVIILCSRGFRKMTKKKKEGRGKRKKAAR